MVELGARRQLVRRGSVAALIVLASACRPAISTPDPIHVEPRREPSELESRTCAELMAERYPEADPSSSRSNARGSALLGAAYLRSPIDTDADGYDDAVDLCPDLPEDFDAFEDEDGCPDCDNDQDGIPDAAIFTFDEYGTRRWLNRDTDGKHDCRNDPEDLDGDRDSDGCPDP